MVVKSICMIEICSTTNESTSDNKRVTENVKHTEVPLFLCYDEDPNFEKIRMLVECLLCVRIGLVNGDYKVNQILNLICFFDSSLFELKNDMLKNLLKEVKQIAEAELLRIQKTLVF